MVVSVPKQAAYYHCTCTLSYHYPCCLKASTCLLQQTTVKLCTEEYTFFALYSLLLKIYTSFLKADKKRIQFCYESIYTQSCFLRCVKFTFVLLTKAFELWKIAYTYRVRHIGNIENLVNSKDII